MFNPGETIVHEFVIPFSALELAKVIVSYKQEDDIVFEKTVTSGFEPIENTENSKFSVEFSQQESLLFRDLLNYTIQLNVLTSSGSRAASKEIKGCSGTQYHRGVITP